MNVYILKLQSQICEVYIDQVIYGRRSCDGVNEKIKLTSLSPSPKVGYKNELLFV
jgi:hypothetical protein